MPVLQTNLNEIQEAENAYRRRSPWGNGPRMGNKRDWKIIDKKRRQGHKIPLRYDEKEE
jgi:hypothetical protein